MDTIESTPAEILEVYRYGQKQGFIVGVVVCLAARYFMNRRKMYQDALIEAQRNRIR